MARPRILPDAEVLGELRRQGLSYQQIADMYGVTKAAVHFALRRSHLIENPRLTYEDEIPWQVRRSHAGHTALQRLRHAARRERGLPLSPADNRYLDTWLRKLEEQDAVVAYHPDEGFFYAPRRPGVDTGLIRVPQWKLAARVGRASRA